MSKIEIFIISNRGHIQWWALSDK